MPRWLKDLAERALATYAQVFFGLILASGIDVISMGTVKAAAVAAIPAALSVVKSAIASRFGEPTASAANLYDYDGDA